MPLVVGLRFNFDDIERNDGVDGTLVVRAGFKKVMNATTIFPVYTFQHGEKSYPVHCTRRAGAPRYEYFLTVAKETPSGMINLEITDMTALIELHSVAHSLDYGVYNIQEYD